MRSNGLQASSYTPVADLNPSVAEAFLDELKQRQIAAYSQPIESPSMSAFDRPDFRVEVLVRMYVDTAASGQVLELLASRDPDLVQANDDLTWAQIVAGYDTPTATEVAPWPVYEDVDVVPDEEPERPIALSPLAAPDRDAESARRRRGSRFEDPAEEDRFVPPPPPPLPRLSAADQVSWLGLAGGPAVLVAAAIFSLQLPSWVTLVAALGFIAGFVSLVVRMGNGEERYDDPDNGAQL